jgi:hypothetical protein
MPKPRPPKGTWETRAADVLAGRVAIDPGDLIDLIHDVNPTGRGRSAEETGARYAVKSRLQSVLVTRFADDLEVAPDPDDPAVVAIRHRYRRHDACHAVVATLDEEARSWVQRELDLADPAPARAEVPPAARSSAGRREAPAAGGEDLLAKGEEAQASYDYERAGRCFAQALDESGGGVAAARAFLAFTVDAIAADAEALAAERRLPAATLADPRVALLLAVAAARAGEEDRALRHLARARDPRGAEVLAVLARSALDEGDADRAARHLRAAEQQDPAHPELRALADGIAGLRASARAPLEAELAALVAAGRDAEALEAASTLLGRWPESEPGRRALRQIDERQRAGEGRRHLAAAEEAAALGETAVALDRLHRALACPLTGPEREIALRRTLEVEAAERARADRAQVDHVVALLGESERARGLAAYVELGDALRARVRAAVAIPALAWLELVPGAAGRVRAAVEAVLALGRAAALAERDPAGAAALIAAHERLLEEVPLAQTLAERARADAAEKRRRRAVATLQEADEALAGGHVMQARELLDRVDLRALPAEDRARADALAPRLGAAEERQRGVRRFERLRAVGSFAAARAAAVDLAAREVGPERARWTAEAAAVAEHAQRRYAPRVDEISGGAELLQDLSIYRVSRARSASLGDGGHEIFLVTVERAWMFVRVFDFEADRVVRVARLSLDAPMHDAEVVVHANRLEVIAGAGVLEISLVESEVLRRLERNWNPDRGPYLMYGVIPPGTRMLWATYYLHEDDESLVKTVDMDGELGGRSFAGVKRPHLVRGAPEPRMALEKDLQDEEVLQSCLLQIHDRDGAQLGRVVLRAEPSAVVTHPSGAGFVVLTRSYEGGVSKADLVEVSDHFEIVATRVIEANAVQLFPEAQLACARDAGMIFVRVRLHAGGDTLVGLRSAGPGVPLVDQYRVPVPARTALIQDPSARRAFAVADYAGGLAVTALGPEPPVLVESGPSHDLVEPFQHVSWCAHSMGDNGKSIERYVRFRVLADEARAAAIAAHEAEHGGDMDDLILHFNALICGAWVAPATDLLARLRARYPGDPRVTLMGLSLLVTRRAHRELAAALEAAGADHFTGPALQHYHHLAALTHATLGDLDAARRHLEQARALPGHCGMQLVTLGKALDALAEPVTGEDLALDRPAGPQIVAVLQAADARLAQGDAAGAVALLERPLVWDLHETQSLSRLAAAYLDLACDTAGERFRKALSLAAFLECVENDHGRDRREALAPGMAWTEERIEALRRSAVAWMEADQGMPREASWDDV